MNNHGSQHISRPEEGKTGFGVDASPLNTVKLRLGFVIVFGLILWLSVDFITPSFGKQLMLLAGYGLLCAFWLVARTRRILKHQTTEHD